MTKFLGELRNVLSPLCLQLTRQEGSLALFGITVMLAGLPNSTDLDQGFCEGAAKRREPVINS